MKDRVKTALLALVSGFALAAAAAAMILWWTNDMRWLLVVGAVGLFGLGLWQGGRRAGGTVAFLLLCLPLFALTALLILPELPGLWPHLPLWLGFASIGWWGFRPARRFSRVAVLALATLTAASGGYALAYVPGAISRTLARTVDKPAPATAFERLDGTPYPAESLADKVVVLDFFATWCAPCIAELPEIDAIYQRYSGEVDVEVLVVANLTGGDTPEKIQAFVDGRDLKVPFLLDPEAKAHAAFGFAGLPGLVVVDPAQRVRFRREGYNAAESGFRKTVEDLVEDLRAGGG
jgi:thiol-disulfide isomerase/thioredoxin